MADPMNEKIRSFLIRNFMVGPEDAGFGDGDSLLQLGLIDSMGVVEIVGWVKKEFGIAVDPSEVTPAHFDSVNAIAAFLNEKLGR